MKSKACLVGIICTFLIGAVAWGEAPPDPKLPKAVVPVTDFNFPEVVDGTEIVHDFIILNKGTGPLNIKKVQTS